MDKGALTFQIEIALFPKQIAHAKLALREESALSRQRNLMVKREVPESLAAQTAGKAQQNTGADFERRGGVLPYERTGLLQARLAALCVAHLRKAQDGLR